MLRQFRVKLTQLLITNWHYLLVIVFGLISSVELWSDIQSGLSATDDGVFHSSRLQTAANAWKDGQILPQVAPKGADGFGYAYNLFYGPLPTYIAAAFRLVRFSWPAVINLTYIILLLISGILMCYAIQKISKNKTLSALVAILYMTAPYHLVDLFKRGAIGEFAALSFVPLLVLGLYQLIYSQKGAVRNITISTVTILLSHNLSAILFAMMSIIIILCFYKNIFRKSVIKKILVAGCLILGLSAFFTVPMLETKMIGDYGIFNEQYASRYFRANAAENNLKRLKASALIWGEYDVGLHTVRNLSIGTIGLFAILAFPFIRKMIESSRERQFVSVLYFVSILSLIFTTTLINWEYMPHFLYNMQFPWRFLSISCVTLSIVAGYSIYVLIAKLKTEYQKPIVVGIGLLALVCVSGLFSFSDSGHTKTGTLLPETVAAGGAGWQAEYLPIKLLCPTENMLYDGGCGRVAAINFLKERGDTVEIKSGDAEIMNIERNRLSFTIAAKTKNEVVLELPLIYYPGYKAKANHENLEVRSSDSTGLVEVLVPNGIDGTIHVYYGLSLGTTVGMVITTLTIAGTGVFIAREIHYKRRDNPEE